MNELLSIPAQEDDQTDLLFDVLSSPRRRHVLDILYEDGDAVSDLGDLADRVAARENDRPIDRLTHQERKCVYVSLYQTHVPKLEESGVVTFDAETGAIALTDRSSLFGPVLGWAERTHGRGHYVLLTIGSSLFYLAVLLDVLSLDWISPFVAGLLVFLLFGALAVAEHHWPRDSRLGSPRLHRRSR